MSSAGGGLFLCGVLLLPFFLCASLFSSHTLSAHRIRFEEANDVGKALHVRKCATRMPGGIQAHSLDSALKLVEAMI